MLSFFKKNKTENEKILTAYVSGKVIPIEEVKDETFSGKMLGDGLAIEPTENLIVSPGNGVVTAVMSDSKHAVCIALDNGLEILLHEGLDTVSLNGEGFKLFVKQGQKVKRGDKLISFDMQLLEEKGMEKTCVMVVTNSMDYPDIKYHTQIKAEAKNTVIAEIS